VVNGTDNTVSVFSNTAGSLTPISGSPFTVPVTSGDEISIVALHPTGRFAYVEDTELSAGSILFTFSIGSGGGLTLVTQNYIQAYHFGFIPLLPPFVYVQNENTNDNTVSAYKIGSTGALSPVKGSPFAAGLQPYSVAIDPTGSYAYVNNFGNDNLSAYAIGSNGALTPISGSPAGNFLVALNVPPIPFATSTSSLETEAGTPPTFTLSNTFTLGRNSTGINPVTNR
jgi:6-phosphogluconolactonase